MLNEKLGIGPHKFIKNFSPSRDGDKTRTHLRPTKPTLFKIQMGGENGF